ncbi:unnamed protein product [Polarella glacialis]|uniref:JmjC domain-containing protein n=1 Tax=Polarella glacialis TaxID=89957 RepID=A0A813LNX7_POLGL|nr:unnamed protein product [Polarella glacialis]
MFAAAAANGVANAKRRLVGDADDNVWHATGIARSFLAEEAEDGRSVTLRSSSRGTACFRDNTERVPFVHGETFDVSGDDLPDKPCVLQGCCDSWPAMADGRRWSVESLAERCTEGDVFSLDGGPGLARNSMSEASVSMLEYLRYCSEDGESDDAPLYIFDPCILTRAFREGTMLSSEYTVPHCFSQDKMGAITGSQYRPLPPAWLLVGAARSGTPIHDHPLNAAWNSLLDGCKLWVIFPPDVDEGFLLLDEGEDYDLSAVEWFLWWAGGLASADDCSTEDSLAKRLLPSQTKIIVQHPGETVFLPPGWWHVVLNIRTSTAISYSLALRRDYERHWLALFEEDEAFAVFWRDALEREKAEASRAK